MTGRIDGKPDVRSRILQRPLTRPLVRSPVPDGTGAELSVRDPLNRTVTAGAGIVAMAHDTAAVTRACPRDAQRSTKVYLLYEDKYAR
jgi:hypothetical protein